MTRSYWTASSRDARRIASRPASRRIRAARDAALNTALVDAALAPLDVMRTAVALLPDLLFVAEQGNPNAASDAAVGALMVKTCVHGSAYNTLINVKSLGEHPMAAALKADCQTIRAACDSFAAMVLATVEAKL